MSEAEGKALADRYSMPFFQTSAKNNINVSESFTAMAGTLCFCPSGLSRERLACMHAPRVFTMLP